MLEVIDNFLGAKETVDFTEKLAGSNFDATIYPDGQHSYTTKSLGRELPSGLFPEVERILGAYHPPVTQAVTYNFELLKKSKRPDFIDYRMDHDVTVAEFGGKLTRQVADLLNSEQKEVRFLTRDDIKKSVGNLIKDDTTRQKLNDAKIKIQSGTITKLEILEIDELLMDLIDTGRVPSSISGGRVEGIFGIAGTKGFKIPSKMYSQIQRDQSGFVAVIKSKIPYLARFVNAAELGDLQSDRLVNDVIRYLENLAKGGAPTGFRTYFSPEEARNLLAMVPDMQSGSKTAVKTAKTFSSAFFKRVKDKERWVSTGEIQAENFLRKLRQMIVEYSYDQRKIASIRISVSHLRRIIKEELRRSQF